jgi:quercetin dioxygenase-like cupin family protein
MRRKFPLAGAILAVMLGAFLGAFLAFSDYADAQAPTPPRTVLREDLSGLDGQEVIMQEAVIAPGGSIPWHKHPDGHEISYLVEGAAKLEIEGQGVRELKPGEGFHIQPGVVHRAFNDSNAPAKVVVVRVNAKGKPIAVPVQK